MYSLMFEFFKNDKYTVRVLTVTVLALYMYSTVRVLHNEYCTVLFTVMHKEYSTLLNDNFSFYQL